MVRLVANYPESRPILSRFIGNEDDETRFKENEQVEQEQEDDSWRSIDLYKGNVLSGYINYYCISLGFNWHLDYIL